MDKTIPRFAVVGHPNRGKSSIVSTLLQDSEVPIDSNPGTTKRSSSFSVKVEGSTLFELFDTPGFQRPNRAYEWLKNKGTGTDSRPYTVRQFVLQPENRTKFPDEVEILKPIIEGAGILYVVDGSSPYGPEYDAELEILRWTGQPRMALINPIRDSKYVENWQDALGQFFNLIRVFNAQQADFNKQLELLSGFAELNQNWRASLAQARLALENDRHRRINKASNLISSMITEMLTLKVEKKISANSLETKELSSKEVETLKRRLIKLENDCRAAVEATFRHNDLARQESLLSFPEQPELFSAESWQLFGLSKTELLKFGAIGGAAVGGGIDVLTGGSSLLMGSLLGGVIGAGSAVLAAGKLVDSKIVFLPLGERIMQTGPIKNISFPHMILERARVHLFEIANRNHANRESLNLSTGVNRLQPLAENIQKKFEKEFSLLRKERELATRRESLARLFEKSFNSSQLLTEENDDTN